MYGRLYPSWYEGGDKYPSRYESRLYPSRYKGGDEYPNLYESSDDEVLS